MKRAKKTRVPAREEALEMSTEPVVGGAEVDALEPAPAAPPPPPSPGQAARKQAEDELHELYNVYEAMAELEGEAEKELTCEKRIFESKQKRIEKSQAGKHSG